jgi:hypothetical protein
VTAAVLDLAGLAAGSGARPPRLQGGDTGRAAAGPALEGVRAAKAAS